MMTLATFRYFFALILMVFCGVFGLTGTSPAKTSDPAAALVRERLGGKANSYILVQKAWKQQSGAKVVLAHKSPRNPKRGAEFDAKLFLVITPKAGKPVIAAEGLVVPAIEDRLDTWEYLDCKFSLDLAPYRLTKDSVAIGVRFSWLNQFPAGENSKEILHLFIVDGKNLRDVFHSVMGMEDVQRGTDDMVVEKTVLDLDQRITAGYRDIILKTTSKTSSVMTPEDDKDPKSSTKVRSRRFKWSGDRYSEG